MLERRALLVGVQTYLDDALPQRPGTLAAMRQLAARLVAGGWTVEVLLDDEPRDASRPLLANVLAQLAWIEDADDALVVLSGASRDGAFLPRDARSAFLDRTTLPLTELASTLPSHAAALVDLASDPGPFEHLRWAVGARDETLFGSRGPTRFLRALVRAASGEAGGEDGLDSGQLAAFLEAHTPQREGETPSPWKSGDQDAPLLPPTTDAGQRCSACGVTVGDPTATFCPSCGAGLHLHQTLDGGRYVLVKPLGEGGMGQVFLAEDTRLKVRRALKLLSLPPGLPEEEAEKLRARMVQEARAAQALADQTHHVVRVFDVGYSPERAEPFLVMELLEGVTLSDRLAQGRMAAQDALTFGRTIASTLAVAHNQGIVHRDLKPDNVMLVERGGQPDFVKLLDFGLVKMDQAEVTTASGRMMGTLQYMPPEQLKGQKVDARADVFSFGAVLYEVLSGRRANPGRTQQEIFGVLLDTGVRPLAELCPGLPKSLCHLVDRCLSLDRTLRPAHAGEVLAELEQVDPVPSGYAPTIPTGEAYPAVAEMDPQERASSSSLAVGELSLPEDVAPVAPGSGRAMWVGLALAVGGAALAAMLWPGDDPTPRAADAAFVSANPVLADAAVLPVLAVDAAPKRVTASPGPVTVPDTLPAKPVATAHREGDRVVYRGGTYADRFAAWARDATAAKWETAAPAVRRWLAEVVPHAAAKNAADGTLVTPAPNAAARPKRRVLRGVGRLLEAKGRQPVFVERAGCGGAAPGDRLVTARWETPGYGSGRCRGDLCVRKLAHALQTALKDGETLHVDIVVFRDGVNAGTRNLRCSVRP